MHYDKRFIPRAKKQIVKKETTLHRIVDLTLAGILLIAGIVLVIYMAGGFR